MFYKIIKINKLNKNIKSEATLEIMVPKLLDNQPNKLPLIFIIPGGAYKYCSSREKDPIAFKFFNLGYACAILNYTCNIDSTNDGIYPFPQIECILAMNYIYKNAYKLNIDRNNINMLGFSAGGHLLGTFLYEFENLDLLNKYEIKYKNLIPHSVCFAYPVISLNEHTHGYTRENLLGDNLSLIDYLSIHKHCKHFPPTFVWTTNDDQAVNSMNTKLLIEALKKNHIKHKAIIFPHGNHGLATADFLTCDDINCSKEISKWPSLYDQFIKKLNN